MLDNINMEDEEIRDVAGKIMDVLGQRLQGAYMQIAEEDAGDARLRKIGNVYRRVGEVRKVAG